jgi:hypothetical protein
VIWCGALWRYDASDREEIFMLKRLLEKYVPVDVLPRKMRVEKIVGAVFRGQTKEDLHSWCLRNGMSEREYKVFFDVVAEKLGDRIISTDTDILMQASQEALVELTEYVSRKAL